MELLYFDPIRTSGFEADIHQLLILADKEFIPPLSARGSSTQADLSGTQQVSEGAAAYYETMAEQPVVLAVEQGRCMGFMAFKKDYTCPQISAACLPNLYASTCVVHPDTRGQGLMKQFYLKMMALFPHCGIYTRTWHTNYSHLKVLERLGFGELARLKDHRGPGLDTVYFQYTPSK